MTEVSGPRRTKVSVPRMTKVTAKRQDKVVRDRKQGEMEQGGRHLVGWGRGYAGTGSNRGKLFDFKFVMARRGEECGLTC